MKGKRKIICAAVVLIIITALLIGDHITGDQFVEILQVLMGSFALANGAEYVGRSGGN